MGQKPWAFLLKPFFSSLPLAHFMSSSTLLALFTGLIIAWLRQQLSPARQWFALPGPSVGALDCGGLLTLNHFLVASYPHYSCRGNWLVARKPPRSKDKIMRLLSASCFGYLPAQPAKPIVGSLMVQDARGRWVSVTETAEATATRGDERIPLKISTELEYGDELRTYNARVEIIWTEGEEAEQVYIWEYAQVTLTGERSVLQQMGDRYFFSSEIFFNPIRHCRNHGRRHRISSRAQIQAVPVSLRVSFGVRDGSVEERVKAGQFVTAGGGAGVATAAKWSGAARRAAKGKTYMDGFAHTELGVMAGGLQLPNSGPMSAQPYGRFALQRPFRCELRLVSSLGEGLSRWLKSRIIISPRWSCRRWSRSGQPLSRRQRLSRRL